MATEIIMPNAGFDTQEARIIEWFVKPGDKVNKGDVIALIESDKANVELESLASGTVLELLYDEDAVISIGAVIARVGSPDEMSLAGQPTQPKTLPISAASVPTAEDTRISPLARRLAEESRIDLARVAGTGSRGRITREDVERHLKSDNAGHEVLALPRVRKAAREAGIDLAQVMPTGTAGQIMMADLETYQQAAAPVAPPSLPVQGNRDGVAEIPLSRTRQIIGSRLQKSKQEAPHFYVTGEYDFELALDFLNRLPEPRPRLNDLIQYLTVRTLMRVPELNATFENGYLYRHESVDLAIAVARDDGLLTPVITGADRFSLEGLAQASRAIIQRARENRLQPADLSGSTFTISNLGVIPQVDHFTAVINPPQIAILAVGTVKPRPVIIHGGIHARHTAHLTISGDHRVVDGMTLGQFLAVFQQELESLVTFQRGFNGGH
jgi:pyruvate dehydrogenase E2 component (dihydrolipoamide acetyltransferase)